MDIFDRPSPKLPPVPAPVPIPDTSSPMVLAERQRLLREAAARSGRASTLLSNDARETLGIA